MVRLATLAQAIESTRTTVPRSMKRVGRKPPEISSRTVSSGISSATEDW
jgi:hypothetical protein